MSAHRRTALAFVLAILLPATALLIRLNFGDAAIGRPTLVLFIIPVTLCAYLAGLVPGAVCTLFSALLAAIFLNENYKATGSVSSFDLVQWSTFIIAGCIISYLAERLHLSQERARSNESRLVAMFNAAMDGIVTLDAKLNIGFINAAAENMFGYKAAALQGTSSLDLVPAQYRTVFEKLIKDFMHGSEPHRLVKGPTVGLRASGEVFPVEATLSRLELQGEPHCTLILRDVSDRQRAENALRRSEALYRSLIEALDEGFTLWDTAGRIEACNPAAERILGWPQADLIGLHYTQIPWRPVAADQAAFDPETLSVAIIRRTREPVLHRERRLTRPDGREIWILQNGIPLPGGDTADAPRVMITFTDITERKKALEALSHMADIVAHSEDAIISKSLDGTIQSWNPGAVKMLGHSAAEAIGQPLFRLVLPAHQHDAEREIRARIAGGGSAQTFETLFLCKDGTTRQILATASPLLDAAGKAAGVSLIARDITERKAAEQALRERDAAEDASRLKSEFLATMSHELRTPLTGVIGFAEYLRAGQAGPVNEEQAECLDSVHKSSLHLLELINGILDLSKIEAGKMELAPETFSLHEAVDEVYGVITSLASKKGIRVERRVTPTLSRVTLDRTKFVQVLYNLLSNGVKFTDTGGCVQLEIDVPRSAHIRIRVADTGIGIDTRDIDKLFKNFHQLDGGDARRHEGAGLGLALTKKIVELQRGAITVESAPGQGSVFTVTLPC